MKLKKEQLENIQIDYGIIFLNYGLESQERLGPTRGGGTFTATQTIRDIEFDGHIGKTKGMQSIDEINAVLNVVNLNTDMKVLKTVMPYATLSSDGKKLTCSRSAIGVIPGDNYLDNVTMFAKIVKGGYKKITLYNAMNENAFSLAAVPKGEGAVSMEIHAHWDIEEGEDSRDDLFEIEDVETIIPVE